MRIAVTGASGFIGTELLAVLNNREDLSVIALTRGGSVCVDTERCIWKTTDYSVSSLGEIIKGVDAVVHLAGVRGTTSNPDDYSANIEITHNILTAMEMTGVKRIVFASTISVYDDVDTIPWREDDTLKGRTMYGESKIKCEELIRGYADRFDFTYAIVRIAQVLGEGEKRRGMMNVFIDTAREKGSLNVIGKSEAKRQYLYVKDLAEIMAILAVGSDSFDASSKIIVNAGMPNAYTNLEIAKIVNEVYDNPSPIEYDDSKPEAIKSSQMDISKLKDLVGYCPMDFRDAISDMK